MNEQLRHTIIYMVADGNVLFLLGINEATLKVTAKKSLIREVGNYLIHCSTQQHIRK